MEDAGAAAANANAGPGPATSAQQSPPRYPGIHSLALHSGGSTGADWYELRPSAHAASPQPSHRPVKSHWQRFKDGFRALLAFIFSNVGICVLVVGYLLLGAMAFQQIEGPTEKDVRYQVGAYRQRTVARLWAITEEFNTLHKENWTRATQEVIDAYQAHIIDQADAGYDGSDIPNYQWTFSGALLYSITVITTIGYGHISPVTVGGKIFSMFYALIGMPLFLLYLANIGDIMAKSFKWIYSRCCTCKRGRKRHRPSRHDPDRTDTGGTGSIYSVKYFPDMLAVSQASTGSVSSSTQNNPTIQDTVSAALRPVRPLQDPLQPFSSGQLVLDPMVETYSLADDEAGSDGSGGDDDTDDDGPPPLSSVTVPISLCLTVMVSYICGGAVLFGEWEGWSFLDGSYFCFITLSTIGFGDIVPGDSLGGPDAGLNDDPAANLEVIPGVNLQFVFCSMYILIGMAVIAMCFNLMQEKVVQGITSLGKKLGLIKDE